MSLRARITRPLAGPTWGEADIRLRPHLCDLPWSSAVASNLRGISLPTCDCRRRLVRGTNHKLAYPTMRRQYECVRFETPAMMPRHAPRLRSERIWPAFLKLAGRFVIVAGCGLLMNLWLFTGYHSLAAPVGPQEPKHHPLLDFAFTNEFGQPVTLTSFKGQALAITFF